MEEYLTVSGESCAEYCEKRSKFIAVARHCATEEEALNFIDEQRKKYWDARHNCFAYTVKGEGISRFSDDGEPHGTAGKPMLDVILGSGIEDVAVVVTRYFGGVLLGTGGLVHAYSTATKDALSSAKKVKKVICSQLKIVCEYTDHSRLCALISANGGIIENTEYTDTVEILFLIKKGNREEFLSALEEKFAARLKCEEICEKQIEI